MHISSKIRRLCLVEGRKVSEVARQFNLSRTTIYKYLDNATGESAYHRTIPMVCPKLDAFKPQLMQWFEFDASRSAHERRTATQLYEGIQLKGYQGAYDSVQRFVKAWKDQSCQFDWSHEQVILAGCAVKIKLAHFRLCHSRKSYLRAYPRETQLPMIINLVHRLAEPVVTDPINITETPVLDVLPVADVNRYDQLHGQEVTHG